MATYVGFQCMHCRIEYKMSGPHLFYREKKTIRYFPHPYAGPFDREIEGMIFTDYCLDCGKERRFITEHKKKTRDEMTFLIDQVKTDASDKNLPYCEKCKGNRPYELEYDDDEFWGHKEKSLYVCPSCHEKALQMCLTIIT